MAGLVAKAAGPAGLGSAAAGPNSRGGGRAMRGNVSAADASPAAFFDSLG
jgi:hypothetical protein